MTVWLLIVLCANMSCGPEGGEIKAVFGTQAECFQAAKLERRKAVCVEGHLEQGRKT